jgi:hypothetical protein
MTDTTSESNALIRAAPKQLAVRDPWLVERGMHSLPILGISERRVEDLCSALWDCDFDNRARALKTIAQLGSHIRSCRHYLDSLIFPVVTNTYDYFGPEATVGYSFQGDLFSHGQHYPPRAEYLELLRTALVSLVGPVQSPDEAIMDVIYYGTTASRIRGIIWLADHALTSRTHHNFSDYLSMSLLCATQKTPLALALKYADASMNHHVDEAMLFFIDEIILEDMPDELKATAREYIVRLQNAASQEALIYVFGKLAEAGNPTERECALELFDEVMQGDLHEYSDDELTMISCFMGWPSDEEDDIDEYEEFVMEELRCRGLHG